ncbi:MAG: RodZ domain-containing protein [Gammaproteobacteria bacterium]
MNKVSDIDTISPAPEADNGLKDVGATLRTVREEQGLRVEEVSERLRLSPDVLLAIEAGDSEHLPATTFLRGYIRSYAKLLRLDENEILSHVADTLEKPRIHLTRNTPFKPQRRLPGKRWLLWGGIGLGVAALLLVAVPLIERLLSKQTATEEAVPTLILPKRESRPAPITPATPVLPTPASPAANAASAAAKLPEKTASVVSRELSLSFAQDTWLEVTYAQKKQVAGIMKAGTRKTFNAAPPIEILLGNAPAVTIEYDGKPFNHQRYIKGKVARFTLK